MNDYFLFTWKTKNPSASAFEPKSSKPSQDLIEELDGIYEFPYELELIKLTEVKDGLLESPDLSGMDEVWLDYQPNSMAWPLMSERLRAVVDKHLTGKEGIDWIKVIVNGLGEKRVYYIPRFQAKLDVLDMEKTLFVNGTDHIIRPCFAIPKIAQYSIFHKPTAYYLWKITSSIYINETLKKAIQKEKLTGIGFEKTRVA